MSNKDEISANCQGNFGNPVENGICDDTSLPATEDILDFMIEIHEKALQTLHSECVTGQNISLHDEFSNAANVEITKMEHLPGTQEDQKTCAIDLLNETKLSITPLTQSNALDCDLDRSDDPRHEDILHKFPVDDLSRLAERTLVNRNSGFVSSSAESTETEETPDDDRESEKSVTQNFLTINREPLPHVIEEEHRPASVPGVIQVVERCCSGSLAHTDEAPLTDSVSLTPFTGSASVEILSSELNHADPLDELPMPLKNAVDKEPQEGPNASLKEADDIANALSDAPNQNANTIEKDLQSTLIEGSSQMQTLPDEDLNQDDTAANSLSNPMNANCNPTFLETDAQPSSQDSPHNDQKLNNCNERDTFSENHECNSDETATCTENESVTPNACVPNVGTLAAEKDLVDQANAEVFGNDSSQLMEDATAETLPDTIKATDLQDTIQDEEGAENVTHTESEILLNESSNAPSKEGSLEQETISSLSQPNVTPDTSLPPLVQAHLDESLDQLKCAEELQEAHTINNVAISESSAFPSGDNGVPEEFDDKPTPRNDSDESIDTREKDTYVNEPVSDLEGLTDVPTLLTREESLYSAEKLAIEHKTDSDIPVANADIAKNDDSSCESAQTAAANRLAAIRLRFSATCNGSGDEDEATQSRKPTARVPAYPGLESAKTRFIAEASKSPAVVSRVLTPPPEGGVSVVENEPLPRNPEVVCYSDAVPGDVDPLEVAAANKTRTMLAKFKEIESGKIAVPQDQDEAFSNDGIQQVPNKVVDNSISVNTKALRDTYLQNATEAERTSSLSKVNPLTEIQQMCERQPVSVFENAPKSREDGVVSYADEVPKSLPVQMVNSQEIRQKFTNLETASSQNGIEDVKKEFETVSSIHDSAENSKVLPVNTKALLSTYLQKATESDRSAGLSRVDPLTEIQQMCQRQPVSVYENAPKSREEGVVSYADEVSSDKLVQHMQVNSQEIRQKFVNPAAFEQKNQLDEKKVEFGPNFDETVQNIAEAKKKIREIEASGKNPKKNVSPKIFNIWDEIRPELGGVYENKPRERPRDVVGAFDEQETATQERLCKEIARQQTTTTNGAVGNGVGRIS